jgi:hypothetical protein
MKKRRVTTLAVVGLLFSATVVQAAYTLFGDAVLSSPGNASAHAVRVTSEITASTPYGGVSFTLPDGTTVDDLATLETDYLVISGDCVGGAPRFEIFVDADDSGDVSTGDRNIFVYIGPAPSFTDCPSGWQSTGNLLTSSDLRVDTSQVGGTFYDTFANAQALVGTSKVLDISFVVDSSWVAGNSPQTFDIDNVNINGSVYTFEPSVPADAAACRNGGWESRTRADFTPFKNQGDCIQYVNTGK